MKCTIFRSSKGDCLLISSPGNGTNHHILFDGGMTTSFRDHVAPYLNKEVKKNNESIDLLCVTHIDEDHIKGVLTLMELMADWRIHHYKKHKNESTTKPRTAEPPEIDAIWHNSFADTYELGSTIPRIEQALHDIEQMTVPYKEDPELEPVHDVATSIKQGITLSQLLRPEQLNIPLNPQAKGKVIKSNQRFINKNIHQIGSMDVTIIGPFTRDLNDLKKEWEEWEDAHATELADFYSNLNITALRYPLSNSELKSLLTTGGSMGDRGDVTIPNLASIIMLVEFNGHSALMTGDGHASDIIKGLKKNKKFDNNGKIHVDILKVQHHGAIANINSEFCEKVIADHYVFCGNGTHTNPELDVVELIYNHRQNTLSDYTFWFNTNPADKLTKGQADHMGNLEEKLKELKNSDNSGHFDYQFVAEDEDFLQIELV